MSLNRFHLIVLGGWFTVVALTIVIRTLVGLPPSAAEGVGAVAVALGPAVLVLTIFRGAPPQTIAEVLYDAENTRNVARERLVATISDPK